MSISVRAHQSTRSASCVPLGPAVAALLLAAVCGYLLGGEAREATVVSRSRTLVAGSPQSPSPTQARAKRQASPDGSGREIAAAARSCKRELDRALGLVQRELEAPADAEAKEASKVASAQMFRLLSNDPHALQQAIERMARLQDKEKTEWLAAILGRIRDPQVESLGVRLIRAHAPVQRAAGWEILDAIDSRWTLELVLQQGSEPSQEVRRAAVSALPESAGFGHDTANRVIPFLSRTLRSDADPETRRRAVLRLATWYRSAADLEEIIVALRENRDHRVRAGAAFALELASARIPRAIDALSKALRTHLEAPSVREAAWHALGSLGPLPEPARSRYASYGEIRDRAREAGMGAGDLSKESG